MIVVDVNAIAYLWIPGDLSEPAQRALAKDPHWVTSILWRSEFRNILAGYLRRGDLDAGEVARCLREAESQLAGFEWIVSSERVMGSVAASSCSAYDCEYVALAEELDVPLLTSDKKILREFPERAIGLERFAG